jgi:acyl carrier protein
MAIDAEIRQYILTTLLRSKSDGQLGDDDDLFQILDSIAVIRIVGHLENTFEIEIQDHEMVPENLSSVRRLAALAQRKLGTRQPT